MFLKYRSQEDENEFPKIERGFFSQKNNVQKFVHFIHKCHIFEGTNPSLSPSFQQFGQIFRAKVDLIGQVAAENEEFPSPTPRDGQDEPIAENSLRKPRSQRINQLLG